MDAKNVEELVACESRAGFGICADYFLYVFRDL
jgi:hypothetical protein